MDQYFDNLLASFATYLDHQQTSPNTYKNYLSDVRRFLTWLTNHPNFTSPPDPSTLLTPDLLSHYRDQLAATVPISTANRHLSSVRKFCRFLTINQLVAQDPGAGLPNLMPSTPSDPLTIALADFNRHLKAEGATEITIRNYLSDIRGFYDYCCDHPEVAVSPESASANYYQYSLSSASPATAARRLSSVKKFLTVSSFPFFTPIIPQPPPEHIEPAEEPSMETEPASLDALRLHVLSPSEDSTPPLHIIPSAPETPPATPHTTPPLVILVGVLILLIILGFGVYFIAQAPPPQPIDPSSVSNY